MKNILYSILIVIIGFSFASCKKKDYHKVTFEIKFLQTPAMGSSNSIELNASPSYSDKAPRIDKNNIPQVWSYDYMGLEKGQKVKFMVSGQLSYYFEMRVFVDGGEVSYRKVKVSDTTYYDDHVEESSGWNDLSNEDMGVIEFTYK